MKAIKFRVYLEDEATRIGSGWREVLARIGRKWVYLVGRHGRQRIRREAWRVIHDGSVARNQRNGEKDV